MQKEMLKKKKHLPKSKVFICVICKSPWIVADFDITRYAQTGVDISQFTCGPPCDDVQEMAPSSKRSRVFWVHGHTFLCSHAHCRNMYVYIQSSKNVHLLERYGIKYSFNNLYCPECKK